MVHHINDQYRCTAARPRPASFKPTPSGSTIKLFRLFIVAPTRLTHPLVHRVFITHMHGDHCFGLLGVIRAVAGARAVSLHSSKAQQPEPLRIFGPPGIHAEVMGMAQAIGGSLGMPLVVYQYAASRADAQPTKTLHMVQDKSPDSSIVMIHLPPDQGDAGGKPMRDDRGYSHGACHSCSLC